MVDNALELRKKLEEVTAQCDSLKEESSGFDLQITQLSEVRDKALAESSRAQAEVQRLEDREFQEGYAPSWFEGLSLDDPSSDEDEATPDEATREDAPNEVSPKD
ncbi:hypothetical protein LIER_04546 [Lithospermum erythrorhizon]|uniref:Uncharacterized protein n=1 Tax=Lithospermum erythrorhizon TaxID=34254 RepID=A0AAV3NY01_LITER